MAKNDAKKRVDKKWCDHLLTLRFRKWPLLLRRTFHFGWKYTRKQKVAKKTLKALHFWHKWLLCSAEWKPTACPVDLVPCRWSWASSSPIPQWDQINFRISFVFYICDFTRFSHNFPFLKLLKFRKFSKDIKRAMLLQNGFIPILFYPIGVHISRRTSFLVYLAVGPLLLACLFPSFLFLWYFRDRISGTVSSFNLKSSFWGLASPPPATP